MHRLYKFILFLFELIFSVNSIFYWKKIGFQLAEFFWKKFSPHNLTLLMWFHILTVLFFESLISIFYKSLFLCAAFCRGSSDLAMQQIYYHFWSSCRSYLNSLAEILKYNLTKQTINWKIFFLKELFFCFYCFIRRWKKRWGFFLIIEIWQ